MAASAYQHLAVCYDSLMDVDYQQWAKYLLQLIDKNPAGVKLLDAGCGTGIISNMMANAGFEVTGVDSSTAMLNIAWKYVKPGLQFVQQDIQHLKLAHKYQIVISTCDVINYITTEEALYNVLNGFYNQLDFAGILLFDISSKQKIANVLGDNSFSSVTDKASYIWENYYDDKQALLTMQLTLFMPYEETGLYYRCEEEHVQRGWSIEQLTKILADIGFSRVNYYQAFTLEPPTEESDRIQFVAYKTELQNQVTLYDEEV